MFSELLKLVMMLSMLFIRRHTRLANSSFTLFQHGIIIIIRLAASPACFMWPVGALLTGHWASWVFHTAMGWSWETLVLTASSSLRSRSFLQERRSGHSISPWPENSSRNLSPDCWLLNNKITSIMYYCIIVLLYYSSSCIGYIVHLHNNDFYHIEEIEMLFNAPPHLSV